MNWDPGGKQASTAGVPAGPRPGQRNTTATTKAGWRNKTCIGRISGAPDHMRDVVTHATKREHFLADASQDTVGPAASNRMRRHYSVPAFSDEYPQMLVNYTPQIVHTPDIVTVRNLVNPETDHFITATTLLRTTRLHLLTCESLPPKIAQIWLKSVRLGATIGQHVDAMASTLLPTGMHRVQ